MSTKFRPFSDVMDEVQEHVDGVGPETAEATMRRFTLQEFQINCKYAAVGDAESVGLLCSIDGVGPKTAERMAVYVRRHVDFEVTDQ